MLSFISSAPSCSHEICTTSSMYHFGLFSPLFSRSLKLSVQLLYHSTRKEGCTSFKMQPSFFKQYLNFLLTEVPLEQALEGLAVAGFIARHLMHGVVNRVEVMCICSAYGCPYTLTFCCQLRDIIRDIILIRHARHPPNDIIAT